jgi:hypothetical protein
LSVIAILKAFRNPCNSQMILHIVLVFPLRSAAVPNGPSFRVQHHRVSINFKNAALVISVGTVVILFQLIARGGVKIGKYFPFFSGHQSGNGELKFLDKRTLKRLEDIENLPDEDRANIFYTIDNLIKAAKLKAI